MSEGIVSHIIAETAIENIDSMSYINKRMKYRMYVDETGNSDLNSSDNPLHRYLGLTGIITELE